MKSYCTVPGSSNSKKISAKIPIETSAETRTGNENEGELVAQTDDPADGKKFNPFYRLFWIRVWAINQSLAEQIANFG